MGRMSKQKGASYERKIVDIFSNFWFKPFRRTPMSGGWGKSVFEDETAFDLVASADFPLHIEMRNRKFIFYERWMEESIEANNKLKQTKKVAALVFHQTNRSEKKGTRKQRVRAGDFAMMELSDFSFIACQEVNDLLGELIEQSDNDPTRTAFGQVKKGSNKEYYDVILFDAREKTGDKPTWRLKPLLNQLLTTEELQEREVGERRIIPILLLKSATMYKHHYVIIELAPAFLDCMDRERFWVDDSIKDVKA